MALFRRFLNIFRPARLSREFDEELEFHRRMRAYHARERGIDTAEAETEARHRMGNLAGVKEEMMDARVIPWLASSVQDLGHGIVLLRRDAGLSGLIVLVLALGIGGNAAIFTLLKAAFLDPLPYREAGRLVTILDRHSQLGIDETNPTIPEFLDIRERCRSCEEAAFLDHRDFQITGADEPVRVFGARVTASFFPMLGVTAALGRTFFPEENLPGRTRVVVLTEQFWRARMGADPTVVGQTLRLDGNPHLVVGVLPPQFTFDYPTLGVPEPAEIYIPYEMSDYYMLRSGGYANVRRVRVLARLRAEAAPAQVATELETAAGYLTSTYPSLYRGPKGEPTGFSIHALALREAIVGKQRSLLWLLLGSAGVLLMIACANTAQLLLARGLRRGREIAIRTALGAGRHRLIRQFLLEALVLGVAGGACGLLLSAWITRALVGLLPVHSPLFESAHADLRVTIFTLAISILSAIIFGILPAMKGSAWTPGPSLTARETISQGNRWRQVMIAVEAALSVFLLCGAGLLGQSMWKLVSTSAGFDPSQVTVMQMRLPWHHEQALNPTPMFAYREYLERVAATPGVESAAVVTGLPLRGAAQTGFRIEGAADDPGAMARQRALVQSISPDYFQVLRIPLLSGRTFRDDDSMGRPPVAIVNQEFVRRFGVDGGRVGSQIQLQSAMTIVGVVGDVRMSALATAPEPQIYVSYLQVYDPNIYLVVRSSVAPPQLMTRIKEAIYSVHSDQAVFNAATMEQILSNSIAEPRFQVLLVGAFALLALTMAASGMHSVVSCLVSQRTSEIAIRMALGASRGAIVKTILGTTAVWVAVGLAGGLGLGLAARNLVRSLSNAAVEGSPVMYAAVSLFFLAVSLAAAYLPVRRASRLDLSVALRCE